MEGIKQLYLDCPSEEAKYDALVRLYGLMTIGSSIIFVRVSLTDLLWASVLTFGRHARPHSGLSVV